MNPKYIILFLTILQYVNSCYITNCPWGGKRSLNSFTSESSSHEVIFKQIFLIFISLQNNFFKCPICANGLGSCFGPNICCGEGLGCLIGTKETNACKLENKLNVPCTTYGKSCSAVKYGKCATESLCCNPGT